VGASRAHRVPIGDDDTEDGSRVPTTTTSTHPLDYVRRRRWTRVEAPAPATIIPPPQDLHLI
jgi:hypothetical protein